MGEAEKDVLRVGFDRKLKLEFHRAKITPDAGLLLYGEHDEALDLMPLASRSHAQKSLEFFKP